MWYYGVSKRYGCNYFPTETRQRSVGRVLNEGRIAGSWQDSLTGGAWRWISTVSY